MNAEQTKIMQEGLDNCTKRIAESEAALKAFEDNTSSEQWVVVSNLWNNRGIHYRIHNGRSTIALGPYVDGLPGKFTLRTARQHAAEFKSGNEGETLSVMHIAAWWMKEQQQAYSTRRMFEEMKAKAEKAE